MFENKNQKVISVKRFRHRLLIAILLDALLLFVSLGIGVLGYHILGNLGWTDSFLNASMILGGMGPVDILVSKAAKIFAGFYALFSGITFFSCFAVVLTPVFHRFLHKFHMEEVSDEEN